MKKFFWLLAAMFLIQPAGAQLGNPNAPKKGAVTFNVLGEPTTIHPITSTDAFAAEVLSWTLDSMVVRNIETFEFEPALAERWEISKDNKVFTFFLRKDAFFHDGKPVTAEDVKFSFDMIFEEKYNALHMKPYYESIAKVEAIDSHTIKVTAKELYYRNFEIIAGMQIVPKHIYSDVEKSKKMNRTVIGSGPYMLDRYDQGQRIVFKKFDKWYGDKIPTRKETFNFDRITYRFVREENVYIEMLKKGDLDYLDMLPEQFVVKTAGPGFDKLVKEKVKNKTGKGYRYVGFNQENEIFKDKQVRVAMSHLFNRDEMNKKFRYGLSVAATGPTDVFSDFASPKVKATEFDPKLAGQILKKAGWADNNKDGVLEKKIGGKVVPFKFSVIHSNKDAEKYLTTYKEDLKAAGIDMEIRYLEWNSLIKTLDDNKFEAVSMGWSTGIDFDPKQIWHSSSASKGGSNRIGYKNKEVDKLIDQARLEPDRKKRIPMLQKVYELIANDAPMVFMFNEQFEFYAHSRRVDKARPTYQYGSGQAYWWVKP